MPKTAKSKQSRAATSPPPQPPRRQVGALCWRHSGKGLRILLITSRDTSRWVIPKGWPMRNRTEPEAAAREAYEEAGLRGTISDRSLGVYTYLKALGRGPLRDLRRAGLSARGARDAAGLSRDRPAAHEWFEPEKAARRVDEHELAALIREFDPRAVRDRSRRQRGVIRSPVDLLARLGRRSSLWNGEKNPGWKAAGIRLESGLPLLYGLLTRRSHGRRIRSPQRSGSSKNGVTSATITAFSAPARSMSARSSAGIASPSASRSARVP